VISTSQRLWFGPVATALFFAGIIAIVGCWMLGTRCFPIEHRSVYCTRTRTILRKDPRSEGNRSATFRPFDRGLASRSFKAASWEGRVGFLLFLRLAPIPLTRCGPLAAAVEIVHCVAEKWIVGETLLIAGGLG
jgi:hypothetical protein